MSILETVKQIFEQIQSTNSKLEKERIIKENSSNKEFLYTLDFLLNPYIVTGLSSKKINKQVPSTTGYFRDAIHMMDYLKTHNTGSDLIIGDVQGFIYTQPEEMQEFYISLFTKALVLGCAANTINKVLGKGFIPQFEVQLAEKYFEHSNKVEGKDFTITKKLDGIRCLIVKDEKKINLFSRQGQPIEGLVDIESELSKRILDKFVLDGELLISNTADIESKVQYKETTKIVRRDGEKHGITFWAFDILELEEFQTQKCTVKYRDRRDNLEVYFSDTEYTKVLPVLYSGNDTSKIIELLNKVRADGEEGCMININDAPYEFKRTQNLLKVKVMQDCDLEITGFE